VALTPGTRLGVYDVIAKIGEGGMGQVYRARDTKLQRDVALKVLPDSLANDPDRLARFTREAQILAALNHPHIAHIHGLEDCGGVRALVMELVEGDDLSQRVARGAIPIDEALPIAKQIAEALEAAHAQGIIHRDLKPANVKVRPDGTVRVLDFGLAKALDANASGATAGGAEAMNSPTFTTPAMTQAGMIVGTAAYMSPEQARGKIADKRADIWAFGCVLYEMLTGTRAFPGEGVSDTIAAVLRGEPDWEQLPAALSPALGIYIRRCLHKDQRQRIHDIADVRLALEGAFEAAVEHTSAPARAARRLVATMAAGALGVAVVTGAAVWVLTRPAESAPPHVSRLTVAFSPANALTFSGADRDLAISPDGSRIAYVGNQGTQLFVRGLDALAPVAVFTGRPRGPFFSPDGQWIGFADGGIVLKKVAVTGGPPVTFATLVNAARGATWGPADTMIVAANNPVTGLMQVGAAGEPTILTRPERARGEAFHLWPEMLPGGRAVLFTILAVTGGLDAAQVAVLDLQTGKPRVLVRGGSHAHYVPIGRGSPTRSVRDGGYLVYAAAGTIRAVAFDLATLEARGAPVPVVPDVVTSTYGALEAVVAGDGTLAYVSGAVQAPARTLVWVDRNGHEEPVKAPARAYTYPRLSPDGTRVAAEVRDQDWDIWVANLVSTTFTRFSFDPSPDRLPTWTPDGRRIIWGSERGGASSIYWQAADGSGAIEQLTINPVALYPSAISPDGTRLIVRQDAPTRDLMVVAIDRAPAQTDPTRSQQAELKRPQPLVQTPAAESAADVSPDGRWVAYQSDESGRDEIYVRPFPDANAGRWQVSTGGGAKPLWARNGRELFYMIPTGGGATVMSAPIERGASFAAGTPTKVLEGPYFFGTSGGGDTAFRTFDVSRDGQRFLMIKLPGGSDQAAGLPSLIVVQHWVEELKRLVPSK